MRGRTFLNKYVIIDEAQNLTPKQMKTLITRAGPGTKIVCMGNLAQIDTPYLTEGSSGLTFAVDKFKGWPHSGHITLARGERSRRVGGRSGRETGGGEGGESGPSPIFSHLGGPPGRSRQKFTPPGFGRGSSRGRGGHARKPWI